jgi:hypothetical protein
VTPQIFGCLSVTLFSHHPVQYFDVLPSNIVGAKFYAAFVKRYAISIQHNLAQRRHTKTWFSEFDVDCAGLLHDEIATIYNLLQSAAGPQK